MQRGFWFCRVVGYAAHASIVGGKITARDIGGDIHQRVE